MSIDCKNYVITHRPGPVYQDDLYRGLCVGGLRQEGMLCELDGENIAQYNDRINELTGLYWIWKNTSSEYVGLCHYRRFFDNGGYRVDKATIKWIMDAGCDIILSPIQLNWSMQHNIVLASGSDLAIRGYEVFRELIQERQPDYVDAFDHVMGHGFLYRCNLFVTRREVMNRYCEWLFSFLTDATDRVDVSRHGGYEHRVCGYFGEAMWTVWLRNNGLRVYDMPIGG